MDNPQQYCAPETERMMKLQDVLLKAGNLIHDAHITALCVEHGVSELITGDRDFARFRGLRILNPFAG